MILRDYQTRACADVRAAWTTHRAVCLVAPTGSGKTVMAEDLLRGQRAWATSKGFKAGAAAYRYKSIFGTWPAWGA